MISTERVLLKGKADRGGRQGWGCLSMGCSTPLLIIGWLALGYTIKDKDIEALQPFVTVIGLMLFLYGCFFMLSGLRNLLRLIRYRILKYMHPEEPWLYDYRWKKEGCADKPLSRILYYLNMALMFGVFALPWNMLAFHPDNPGLFMFIFGIFVLAFDGTVVYLLYRAALIWFRWYKYGVPFIWYDHFPYHPGEELNIGLGATRETGPYTELDLDFRLIEEVPHTGKEAGTDCYQVYSDRQVIKEPDGFILGEEHPIPLVFSIPEDQNTTDLSSGHTWYWELKAEVPTKGVDFKATFLIPVYTKK